jgi:hypothetical protein
LQWTKHLENHLFLACFRVCADKVGLSPLHFLQGAKLILFGEDFSAIFLLKTGNCSSFA